MEFLIVSGLSGGGKSRAADVLEDLDFYCVDNMPTALLTKFAELCLATRGRYEKVALVTDIRSQESFTELFAALGELADMGVDYRILFVEASESAIVRRYKESRRPHPLQAESRCSLPEAVRRESELLAPVRERADYVINTTGLTLSMLQKRICEIFVDGGTRRDILINVVAFGFKYGIPIDADLVFDVRFLPNPYYVEKLRPLSGMDDEVQEYVLRSDVAHRHDRFSPAAVRCRGALCAHDRYRLHRRPAPQCGRGQGADGLSRRARRERPSAQPGLPENLSGGASCPLQPK